MGMTYPETAWEKRARLIGPRQCRAIRAALDLTMADLAGLAGVPVGMVHRVELLGPGLTVDLSVPAERRAISDAFAAIGGEWCAADTHEGAHSIHLVGRSIDDRRAFMAALVLMPATINRLTRLVHKRSGIPATELRRALLDRRRPLPPLMASECRFQLERADCYFLPSPLGGWGVVGCHLAGWPK